MSKPMMKSTTRFGLLVYMQVWKGGQGRDVLAAPEIHTDVPILGTCPTCFAHDVLLTKEHQLRQQA